MATGVWSITFRLFEEYFGLQLTDGSGNSDKNQQQEFKRVNKLQKMHSMITFSGLMKCREIIEAA